MAKSRKMEASSEAEQPQVEQQNNLTAEQAINIIYTALEKGQKAGAYTLKESRDILTVFESIAKALSPQEEK